MKYIFTLIILFLVWKVWRNWESVRNLKAQYHAREVALAEFETLITTLEIKHANGELTSTEFRLLREKAMNRLRTNLER